MLKKTHWYKIKHNGDEELTPLKEEEITDAEWIDGKDLGKVLANTYPSIIDVINEVID